MGRKLIVVVVLGLGAALAAAPAVLGWHTEQTYADIAGRVNADHADTRIRIDDYERGWLGARADYTVEIGGGWADLYHEAGGPEGPLRIHGRDRIRHGPWVGNGLGAARVDSELRMTEALEALGHSEIAREPVIHARSVVSVTGGLDSRFHIPDHRIEFEATGRDGEPERLSLNWREAGGRGGIEGDTTRVLLTVAEIALATEGGDRLTLNGLEIGDRSRRGDDGLWLGRMHLAIEDVALVIDDAAEPVDFHMKRLTIENHTDADDSHARADTIFAFDRARANGVTVGDGELHAHFSHLAREPLARLAATLERVQRQVDADPKAAEIDDATEAELTKALGDLLRGSPQVRTERFHVDTAEGPIGGELRLRFDGERPFDPDIPVTLIDPISGHLELRIPAELARRGLYASMRQQLPEGHFEDEMDARLRQQVEQTINILVAMGLIDREEQELIFRVEKETGEPPLVNDQDIMAMIQAIASLME